MKVQEKTVRKFLSKKIQQLNNIVADLDALVTEIGTDYFRVSIFGSARIKPNTEEYTKLQADAREQALERMIADAINLNADAVINLRFSTSLIMQGASEILAYGTAVKLA